MSALLEAMRNEPSLNRIRYTLLTMRKVQKAGNTVSSTMTREEMLAEIEARVVKNLEKLKIKGKKYGRS